MQKMIPPGLLAVVLSACGGGNGNGGGTAPESLNVTGKWGVSLQTEAGGGLGGGDMTLTQTAPSQEFKGNLATSTMGGQHPIIGNAETGNLKTDLSSSKVNKEVAFACEGQFTKTSYRGNCKQVQGNGTFALVLNRK